MILAYSRMIMIVYSVSFLQQAMSQSHGYYVSEPSPYGNYLIPVLPRFDSDGKLVPMS